ncbi:LuxR family transcriptional regulator [Pseudomonas sp. R37(2017)]|uniref:helix-turn-helix transcriptional regulator n=1 Tax=Pseudomonas sp. R37(2017) TaxID=1981685 RepID=UPI000A1FB217|nr:LuxR family transcriptional regulator [Pseudomonas sp. R37(2017)]
MYTASPAQFRSETPPTQSLGYAIPPKLSAREQEILKWCAMGKSSWEIGRILNCSEAGVNYHFCNIRRKFGVSSRWLALVKAMELGLVELKDREGPTETRQAASRKKGRGSSVSCV